MKKIISNRVYDTATAQELASYANGGSWRDFSHFEETLYRKKTGEYFLHGEGGAMTRYAEAVGQNEWSGGERIMPLTYDEASKWAQEHLDGDEYERIFGEVVEDDTRRTMHYSLSTTAVDKLRRLAQQSGKTASAYLDELILSL